MHAQKGNSYYSDSVEPLIERKRKPPIEKEVRVVDLKKQFRDPSAFMEILHHWPILQKIMEAKGIAIEETKKLREILGTELYKYLAKGRLAHRKKVPGWSKEFERSIKSYFSTVLLSYAKRYHRPDIQDIFKVIPDADKKYGQRIIDFWTGEKQYEGRINRGTRRVMYDFSLGLKPSFFILNTTQRLSTGLPLAISESRARAVPIFLKAQAKELSLYKDFVASAGKKSMPDLIRDSKHLTLEEKRVLSRMFEAGELGAVRQQEITGNRKANIIELFGYMSEHSNRIHSALVGAKLGKEKGLKLDKLYDYARDFVGRSQFVYSKATRPQIGRGVKAPVFVFKSYVLNYANFLKYLYGKDKLALTTAVATFLALSGLKGIPGYNVMRNAVTWAMRKAGLVDDEENMKKKVKEFEDSIDKKTAGMILHGVPSVVGIEGSWTFGAPELFDLVPVTMYEMGKRFYAGLGKKGLDITERMGRIAPTELKKLIRLYQMKVQKKMATDIYGKPKLTEEDIKHMPMEIREYATKVWQELPTDMDTLESILFGLGFPTRTYGKYQQDVYDVKQIARDIREYK